MYIGYFASLGLLLLGFNASAQTLADSSSTQKLVMQFEKLPLLNGQGAPYYEATVAVPNASAQELYTRARIWVQRTTGTKPFQDSTAGKLTSKAQMRMLNIDPKIFGTNCSVTITVSVGGYKVYFDDFKVSESVGYTPFYDKGFRYNSRMTNAREKVPHKKEVYAETDKQVNELAVALQQAMKGQTP